jgi:hypothetical protein
MQPGRADGLDDPVGELRGIFVARHVRLQDGKLVAAEPGDRIGFPYERAQPAGDLDQELVAHLMAESVVDVLEGVQINKVEREGPVAAPGAGDLAAQPIGQQRAVRKRGQRVMMRHIEEVIFGALAVGNVERGRQHADHDVGTVAQRRFRRQEYALGAGNIDDFFLVTRQRRLRVDDLAVERVASADVVLAEHRGQAEPDRFVRIDPEKRSLVCVDEQDAAIAVGRPDDRGHGVNDLREPFARIAQRLFVRSLGVLEFPFEAVGAAGKLNLLLAQLQEVAGAREEFLVVDRAVEEVGCAGLQRAHAEFALFVDRDDDDRDFAAVGLRAVSADEFGAVHRRHFEIGDDQVGRVMFEPYQEIRWISETMHRHARFNRSSKLREDLAVGCPVVEDNYARHASHVALRFQAISIA